MPQIVDVQAICLEPVRVSIAQLALLQWPAQVFDRLSPEAVQVHKPYEEGAVCVEQRREMRRVESGCMLPDLPHDTAHALIAPADSARWCPRFGRGRLGRGRCTHDFAGGAAFSRRRAARFSRLNARTLHARPRAVSVRDSYFQ
jgi:hypothetical protein